MLTGSPGCPACTGTTAFRPSCGGALAGKLANQGRAWVAALTGVLRPLAEQPRWRPGSIALELLLVLVGQRLGIEVVDGGELGAEALG